MRVKRMTALESPEDPSLDVLNISQLNLTREAGRDGKPFGKGCEEKTVSEQISGLVVEKL